MTTNRDTRDTREQVLIVSTPLSEKKYWIKLCRNNQYFPYDQHVNARPKQTKIDSDGWQVVHSKKKPLKPTVDSQLIYFWVVREHNLFDMSDPAFRLFFTDPDTTQIENNDQNNYMAINSEGQLRLIHMRLKHKGMKMTPNYFIAKNINQIIEALKYVKYCVVRIENNEQKLVDV
jgi:hypothetical protein